MQAHLTSDRLPESSSPDIFVDNPSRRDNSFEELLSESGVYCQVSTDTVDEQQKSRLLNRLLVCLFAIFFLWGSSLQLSIFIVNLYLSTPTLTTVVNNCYFAYEKVYIVDDAFKTITCIECAQHYIVY